MREELRYINEEQMYKTNTYFREKIQRIAEAILHRLVDSETDIRIDENRTQNGEQDIATIERNMNSWKHNYVLIPQKSRQTNNILEQIEFEENEVKDQKEKQRSLV